MSRGLRVYIAGPIEGSGRWDRNTFQAINAAEAVLNAGHTPFIPHTTTALWALVHDRSVGGWINYDLRWLDVCDALVRLPGESPGSDIEVNYAHDHGIDVYYGLETFLDAEGNEIA